MKAISPILSVVLVFLLIVFSITITLAVIKPAMDRISDSSIIQEAVTNLNLINSIIEDLSTEAVGSKRIVNLFITDGEIIFDSSLETVSFKYERKSDLEVGNRIGNILVDSGTVEFEDYFNNNISWICRGSCSFINNNRFSLKGAAFLNLGKNISNFYLKGDLSGNGIISVESSSSQNIVLYLPFDEGSGNIAYDYSGNNNNGTLYNGSVVCGSPPNASNCPTWVDGKVGKALSFDGVDDYVSVPDSVSLDVTNTITVVNWFKSNSTQSYRFLVYKRLGNSSGYVYGNYLTASCTSTQFYINTSSGVVYAVPYLSQVSLCDNAWHQLVGTYDGNNLNIYFDGQLKNSTVVGPVTLTTSSNPLYIGSWVGNNQFFNGTIDEVRIYNRALSDEEIKALYLEGLKKLSSSGYTDLINSKIINTTIFLSSPQNFSSFDNIRIVKPSKEVKLTLPLDKAEISKNVRIGKGSYNLEIKKVDFNETTRKSVIEINII